jgi:glycerol-3-phosphate O-acyltransferase
MLAYYRNSLIHLFLNDAEIAISILGFSSLNELQQGVKFDHVFEKCMYLRKLLSEEFVVKNTMKTKSDFVGILSFLQQRGFMEIDHG